MVIFRQLLCKCQGGLKTYVYINTSRLEILGHPGFSEDFNDATNILHQFLQSLQGDDREDQLCFKVSSLYSVLPDISLVDDTITLPSFLAIYDHLVDTWMASLPLETSVPTRLSKYRAVRQMAIELGFSSIACSLRNKAFETPEALNDENTDDGRVWSRLEGTPVSNARTLYPPERSFEPSQDPYAGLPTPNRTPSLYSHMTDTSASEVTEDPATSRLRQYAISIKPRPDPGKSKTLSQWVTGMNPAKYSWEAVNKAAEEESADEGGRRKRREEARHRKLTAKFLSRERLKATTVELQPSFPPMGSQPEPSHRAFSSQPIDEVPMTQPDRGIFGSRAVQKPKKAKHRNAGF
jgi:RNA polymerase I-specific transcription initiation factor RRN6